jgi:hypothetical protein
MKKHYSTDYGAATRSSFGKVPVESTGKSPDEQADKSVEPKVLPAHYLY